MFKFLGNAFHTHCNAFAFPSGSSSSVKLPFSASAKNDFIIRVLSIVYVHIIQTQDATVGNNAASITQSSAVRPALDLLAAMNRRMTARMASAGKIELMANVAGMLARSARCTSMPCWVKLKPVPDAERTASMRVGERKSMVGLGSDMVEMLLEKARALEQEVSRQRKRRLRIN